MSPRPAGSDHAFSPVSLSLGLRGLRYETMNHYHEQTQPFSTMAGSRGQRSKLAIRWAPRVSRVEPEFKSYTTGDPPSFTAQYIHSMGLAGDNYDWLPPTKDLWSRVRGSRKSPSFLTSTTSRSRERKFCTTWTEERSRGCQRVRSAPGFRHTPDPHFSVSHFIRYVGTGGRAWVVTTYFP